MSIKVSKKISFFLITLAFFFNLLNLKAIAEAYTAGLDRFFIQAVKYPLFIASIHHYTGVFQYRQMAAYGGLG